MYVYNDGNKPLIEGAHSELETVLFHVIRITYKRSKCKSAYVLKVLIVLFWSGMVGETIQEAIANDREALRDCMDVFKEAGRKLPKPSVEAAQWRQRLPQTLYSKLTRQAQNEGVSINSLVTAIIAEAIGSRQAPSQKRR